MKAFNISSLILFLILYGFASQDVCWATFPVTGANINNGTVMPQSPSWPFPQFLEYQYGKSLAATNADGVPHAEMEAAVTQAYIEGMHRLQKLTGLWMPSGSSIPRLAFTTTGCGSDTYPGCSEGDGYALLMAALMADKDTFDGLWIHIHSRIVGATSYETNPGTAQITGWGATSCQMPGLVVWTHATTGQGSATDGDEDICMALLIAWKQWGANSGYQTAAGANISYQQEFINYATAMTAWKQDPGDSNGVDYDSAEIGFDGYVKGGNTSRDSTTWDAPPGVSPFPPYFPGCSPGGYGTFSGNCATDYLAPSYYRCFSSVMDAQGNTQVSSQFLRAAVSSEYIVSKMNSQVNPYPVGPDGFDVDAAGNVTFYGTSWGPMAEGLRMPYRNSLDYLWYGLPPNSWDPVNHVVLAAPPTGNMEETFLSKYSQVAWNGVAIGNAAYNGNYGLLYWGVGEMDAEGETNNGIWANSNTSVWHNPDILGPAAMAACAADNLDTLTSVSGSQVELMKDLWRDNYLYWDMETPAADGTYGEPRYFHAFYRWAGLLTLSGNFANPASMAPQPNMKVYKSVNKTFAYAGDTLTYTLSYRNYGAANAGSVNISDALPSDLFYLSSSPAASTAPAVGSSGTVKWDIGTVPGLQNTAGGGTNKSLHPRRRHVSGASQPRRRERALCNSAQIYVGNTLQWTSNQYPNEISMVFKRNCVDVVPRGLIIAKSANPAIVNPNGTSTFSIVVTDQAGSNYWLNGGRPKVYPGFSAVTETYGYMGFYSQLSKGEETGSLRWEKIG